MVAAPGKSPLSSAATIVISAFSWAVPPALKRPIAPDDSVAMNTVTDLAPVTGRVAGPGAAGSYVVPSVNGSVRTLISQYCPPWLNSRRPTATAASAANPFDPGRASTPRTFAPPRPPGG